MSVKIYNEDCLEGLRKMRDNQVDLVLTDPPYGIDILKTGRIGKAKWEKADWDKNIPPKEAFDEMLRVSKNQIIFGGNYFAHYLPPSSCWIVWDKDNGNTNFADAELLWTSFPTAARIFKWLWDGARQQDPNNREKKVHPTQKPLPLMVWLLQKYAKPGQTVLDPYVGSGTTALACEQQSMHFIGFDIDPKYTRLANTRLRYQRIRRMLHGV